MNKHLPKQWGENKIQDGYGSSTGYVWKIKVNAATRVEKTISSHNVKWEK